MICMKLLEKLQKISFTELFFNCQGVTVKPWKIQFFALIKKSKGERPEKTFTLAILESN